MISVTALPRKTFQYVRIQTVILELSKGYKKQTIFKIYEHEINNINKEKL
jgi:hypothetical protein